MAILMEDLLVLPLLLALGHRAAALAPLALAALAAALRKGRKAERGGGVVFATLLGPILACAYQEEAMIHAGDAANSMLWVLASAQSLGNLLLPPLAVTALAVSACAGLGLSFWPSVAFLVVHQLGHWRAQHSSCEHCFSLAEIMFWSQGSGFITSVFVKGVLEAFQFWRPICTFWSSLVTIGLVFLVLTVCFEHIGCFAPLLAALVAALLFGLWGLSSAIGGAIWWFLGYILEEQNLRLLLFLWPGLLCVGLLVVEMLSRRLLQNGELSLMKKHLLRKSFHLLAICLFAPPLLTGQGEFLALAQLVAALLFIALEVCRACRAPLCHIQDRFLSKYLDKREDISRDLVLTHLYLLLGCSLPVWLESFQTFQSSRPSGSLRKVAGLLLIGVGDSCAALFGIRFGQRRWPGSHRSLLGSLAFVLSVSLFAAALVPVALLEAAWLPFLLATSLTALLEVYTKTVDNLSLPLFFCAFLKALEMQTSENP